MALQYPYPADKFDLISTVTRSHGLKGEIKILPHRGVLDEFENYSRVALVATDGRMTDLLDIIRWRTQGKQVILKLDTIDTKSEADLTISMAVLCASQDHPGDEGEGHGRQLVGLSVWTTDKLYVGTIDSISYTGGHPLLVIVKDKKEFLVPLVNELVVDRNETSLIIDPPPGLLEINRG